MNPGFLAKWVGPDGSNPCRVQYRAVWRALEYRRMIRVAVALSCVLFAAGCGLLPPANLQANTVLLPTMGNQATGTVDLIERSDGVQVNYDFRDLRPYHRYALHLHAQGNCDARDASSAGEIFNPDGNRLVRGARPAGALGEVRADSNGDAHGFILAPQLTLGGAASVIGRSLLLHAQPDEDDLAPDLSAGPALACGVIQHS